MRPVGEGGPMAHRAWLVARAANPASELFPSPGFRSERCAAARLLEIRDRGDPADNVLSAKERCV